MACVHVGVTALREVGEDHHSWTLLPWPVVQNSDLTPYVVSSS